MITREGKLRKALGVMMRHLTDDPSPLLIMAAVVFFILALGLGSAIWRLIQPVLG